MASQPFTKVQVHAIQLPILRWELGRGEKGGRERRRGRETTTGVERRNRRETEGNRNRARTNVDKTCHIFSKQD